MVPKKDEYESPFRDHIPIEMPVLAVVSFAAAVLGISSGLSKGSILGWLIGGIGAAGFLALFIHSIYSQAGCSPSFERFKVSVFLFFVIFGAVAGITAGKIGFDHSRWMRVMDGLAGLVIGYFGGICAGLWIQKLGWIGGLLEVFAIAGTAGTAIVGILMML
ncbi:MAG: hypothetical protein A2077_02020 [Nitrospirae bacterium GWC2_46_6]|nr:MAG: hypothetical protein A2077_02020 [Nitrospirae bacterium GWC2_46_6]OGW21875.1 MAG: hypothetical protein A2Z82_09705 [Nitrospirae bacterium GWA2_46_11]OGW25148.1 MAG: hypothetical protein A2X55_11730 [Nitrospirae bacterium GWB2_47_37]HAK89572.1 hypothetical protein [Nitrospiraceae bacterium]HCL81588.1 hypothetical protein [Nitrospiraceae bacterium]